MEGPQFDEGVASAALVSLPFGFCAWDRFVEVKSGAAGQQRTVASSQRGPVALAAVILVSAVGLFDLADLQSLLRMSYREFLMSASTTLGVLVLGVLPGVLLAVTLSLIWLLSVASRPNDAVLGRVPGQKGFHNVADYPEAKTIPGLLLYRFESNVVFFNADYLKTRMRAAIAAQKTRSNGSSSTPVRSMSST